MTHPTEPAMPDDKPATNPGPAPDSPEAEATEAHGPDPSAETVTTEARTPESGAEPEVDAPESEGAAGQVETAAEPGASESPSAESTAESTSDTRGTVGATTPAWWSWVGRHRKPVGIVVALVVVAVVATVVTVSALTPGPKDVVQSYLDAIRAGDTQAALDIAGEPEDDDRVRFLSEEALADDWSVTSVVERHRGENEADVDVTITAGDTTGQGRFHLVKGDDDGWTIESPFVRVDLVLGGLDTIELGDVRQPVGGDAQQGSTVSLLLFPGVYELFPSLRDRVTFDPGVLVAAPQPSVDSTSQLTATYTLTEEGAAAANGAVAARVEECESMPGLSLDGCPFSAEYDPALYPYSDVVDITWAVTAQPEARFVPSPGGALRMVVRTPGTVTLSGRGLPYEPEGAAPKPFTVTCEFGVDGMAVAITVDGVTMNTVAGRPYAAQETTSCF